MINIPIHFSEKHSITRISQPVAVSIPFAKGGLLYETKLSIKDEKNNLMQCQQTPLSYWDDKSIKWVKLDFVVDIQSEQKVTYYVIDEQSIKKKPIIDVSQLENRLEINTRNACFFVNTLKNKEFIIGSDKKEPLSSRELKVKLIGEDDSEYKAIISHSSCYQSKSNCNFTKKVNLYGYFFGLKELALKFEATLTFFNESSYIKVDFTIHNPNAAEHVGGLWDLGDPNSMNFQSLAIQISTDNDTTTKIIDHISNNEYVFENDVCIEQFSSGGKNWNSPVHKNANGKVTLKKNGFTINGKDFSGLRITPAVIVANAAGSTSVYVENFWQNFPKARNKSDNLLSIELFPKGEFELQPGEKKTHSLWVDFESKTQDFDWLAHPLLIIIEPEYIESTGAIEYFTHDINQDVILDIIHKGIEGSNTFFDKREVVDEYGWRNFGDLYADHETEGYKGCETFVSHYNNQYDPIYGFIYQYLQTGKQQWFELANDLAKHVTDIDIYHTKHDKDEYNGGLFWHTDHYLDASTSTHRTFSKNHQAAYDGYTSGGGPGGQHCYSTGLKLHYFLTGDESSKQAVLQLTDWITYSFEGSNTFIAKVFAIKQSGRHGVKNHLTGQYPLDRGTGHYVVALLDSFDLTNENSYLNRATNIIKHTFHPCDDMLKRNFSNIEETWFYTVFLQAVGRYLLLKEQLEQFDEDFYYARDAFLHYVDWMCEYEKPYLDQQEKLEFPNATWTGQDLRKVGIFYIANYYSSIDNIKYLNKAEYFYQYVINNLIHEPSSNYTRIRVLLMQNYGSAHFYQNKSKVHCFEKVRVHSKVNSQLKVVKIIKILIKELLRLSIKKEFKWLSFRSTKVAKLFGNKF